MNLVIQDDEGQIIYGHEVLKRISQTGMTPEVNIVRGILPECFITYVSRRFPEVKEARDLVASCRSVLKSVLTQLWCNIMGH